MNHSAQDLVDCLPSLVPSRRGWGDLKRNLNFSIFALLGLLLFCSLSSLHALANAEHSMEFFESQIEPKENENFSFAQAQCWLPSGLPHGVLCVVLHPHGNTGVRFENSQPWIDLAQKYQCALLSLSFVEREEDAVPWCHAAKGSGRALLNALDQIADESGADALKHCPIVIAGICGAGQFAYEFAAYSPERVKGFLTMGGSKHELGLADRATSIPGLLIAATDRGGGAIDNMYDLFALGQKRSAPWSFCAEPMAQYDHGRSSLLAKSFMEAMLFRLERKNNPGEKVLLPLNQLPSDYENYPQEIAKRITAIKEASLNCIFPDENTAKVWLGENKAADEPDLSFVSLPLPKLGVVTPERVMLGQILIDSADASRAGGKFHVSCEPCCNADQVKVVTDQKGITFTAEQTGGHDWMIDCKLDAREHPCGPFRVEIPIRFFHAGKVIAGGVSVTLVGRIYGDIQFEPAALKIDPPPGSKAEYSLRLRSRSGRKIEVIDVQSSYPDWATSVVESNNDYNVGLKCAFSPPPMLTKKSFSGYFLVRANSNREQILKVLYYRAVPNSDP